MKSDPFHYPKFRLREIKLVRGNHIIVSVKTSDNKRAYVSTLKALKFHEDGPDVSLTDYPDHYVQIFDLTSTQEANVQMYYPDVVAASLRLELYFEKQLDNTVEVIIILGKDCLQFTLRKQERFQKMDR